MATRTGRESRVRACVSSTRSLASSSATRMNNSAGIQIARNSFAGSLIIYKKLKVFALGENPCQIVKRSPRRTMKFIAADFRGERRLESRAIQQVWRPALLSGRSELG